MVRPDGLLVTTHEGLTAPGLRFYAGVASSAVTFWTGRRDELREQLEILGWVVEDRPHPPDAHPGRTGDDLLRTNDSDVGSAGPGLLGSVHKGSARRIGRSRLAAAVWWRARPYLPAPEWPGDAG